MLESTIWLSPSELNEVNFMLLKKKLFNIESYNILYQDNTKKSNLLQISRIQWKNKNDMRKSSYHS